MTLTVLKILTVLAVTIFAVLFAIFVPVFIYGIHKKNKTLITMPLIVLILAGISLVFFCMNGTTFVDNDHKSTLRAQYSIISVEPIDETTFGLYLKCKNEQNSDGIKYVGPFNKFDVEIDNSSCLKLYSKQKYILSIPQYGNDINGYEKYLTDTFEEDFDVKIYFSPELYEKTFGEIAVEVYPITSAKLNKDSVDIYVDNEYFGTYDLSSVTFGSSSQIKLYKVGQLEDDYELELNEQIFE